MVTFNIDEILRVAKEKGVSPTRLCTLSKVHRSTLSRGRRGLNDTSASTLARLIRALNKLDLA